MGYCVLRNTYLGNEIRRGANIMSIKLQSLYGNAIDLVEMFSTCKKAHSRNLLLINKQFLYIHVYREVLILPRFEFCSFYFLLNAVCKVLVKYFKINPCPEVSEILNGKYMYFS